MSQRATAYEVLGVTEESSLDVIKQAFHKKAMLHHPDQGGKTDDFVSLKKAFDILNDPKRRELLGTQPLFETMSLRIKPSRSSNLDTLLKNLDVLRGELNKASNE